MAHSDRESSPELGGAGTSGGRGRKGDEGKNQLINIEDLLSDGEDIKPVIPPELQLDDASSNTKFKKGKGKQKAPEVIDLCDESDGETPPPPSPSSQQQQPVTAQAVLTAIRSMVPDVEPLHLVQLYKARGRNGDVVVNELLGGNYPLRGGGWKLGYAPGEEDEDEEALPKHKPKKVTPENRKRPAPSSDADDEEEVDELASDYEAGDYEGGDEGPRRVYTKDEAMDDFSYWADPEARKPGSEDYVKAARDQLYRDFDNVAELQIRQVFEKTDLYAPTWFALARLKKSDDLVTLKSGPRDMDAPIKKPDGTTKERAGAPKSRLLAQEVEWLDAYLKLGGKATATVNGTRQWKDKSPKKGKAAAKEKNPPRTPREQSATKQQLKGQPKQKKRRHRVAYQGQFGWPEEGDCFDPEAEWRAEMGFDDEDEDAFEDDHNSEGWGPRFAPATANKFRGGWGAGASGYKAEYGRGGVGAKVDAGLKAFSGAGRRLE
ncbi:hypothetical protein JCM10213_003093 [Rhodosporidiobolus nylandii]